MSGLSYIYILLFGIWFLSVLFTLLLLLRLFGIHKKLWSVLTVTIIAAVTAIFAIRSGLFYQISLTTSSLYCIIISVIYMVSLAFPPRGKDKPPPENS